MTDTPSPELSLVIPSLNERENLAPLMDEIATALDGRLRYEVVLVDDGSDDGSAEAALALQRPWLRVVRHASRCGKSAALMTGARAAQAPVIATLDADRQNDPKDILSMWQAFQRDPQRIGLVAGQRLKRRDTLVKRLSSRIANKVRRSLLKDGTRDTGCGMKLFPRQVFLELPLFEGLHRFLPAIIRHLGLQVALVDVTDRPRAAGITKYGLWNRLWVGIGDLLMVWWMLKRRRLPHDVREINR